jgi:hypothetical protein
MSITSTASRPVAHDRIAGRERETVLRLALRLDAAVTAANGAAYLALAGPLEDLLGLEPSLLRPAGALLLVFAAAVWLVAGQRSIPRVAVLAVVAVNGLWVAGSLALASFGWGSPETAGTVWVVLQALVVAAFAEVQALTRPRD